MFLYHVLFPLAISKGFVYHSERELALGARVLVDFKGVERVGVVWSLADGVDYETKPILKVLDNKPILDQEFLESLKFFSFYYMTHEGLFLKSALPRKVFETKGLIDLEPLKPRFSLPEKHPFDLTDEQKRAIESIKLDEFRVHLLFGVTGSGKTEVYLRIIEELLKLGKKSVVLVPEIALTPQYIKVFSDRFSKDAISIVHSRLTKKEKYVNWLKFTRGETPILIGTRSAVFVSFEDVGIVVVDEENDESYKQDNQPLYNAKDIAIYRAKKKGIPVILSSATPSLESLHKAVSGKFNLIRLSRRVGSAELPDIRFVKLEGDKLLSDETVDAIGQTLEKRETAAVLINRRGYARYLVCEKCGYVFRCPNCSVSLVYHKESASLKCHWCDSVFDIPKSCPRCGSFDLTDRGIGSQKIEEELKRIFTKARIQRFDRDVTSKKGEFERIINDLHDGKIDILVGTQMLSKGHDVSRIGLVVIADFESLFSIPDFRAFEKGVSLIIQTAGRSGRRSKGSVIIQTLTPTTHLSDFIINHNYYGFFDEEIKTRELFNYPPFCRLIRVVSSSVKMEKSLKLIENVYEIVKDKFTVIGPSRCPIFKIRNRFRYHLIIKTNAVLKAIDFLNREVGRRDGIYFDVDPISFF